MTRSVRWGVEGKTAEEKATCGDAQTPDVDSRGDGRLGVAAQVGIDELEFGLRAWDGFVRAERGGVGRGGVWREPDDFWGVEIACASYFEEVVVMEG